MIDPTDHEPPRRLATASTTPVLGPSADRVALNISKWLGIAAVFFITYCGLVVATPQTLIAWSLVGLVWFCAAFANKEGFSVRFVVATFTAFAVIFGALRMPHSMLGGGGGIIPFDVTIVVKD
jgi:hypothetical protein